MLFAQLVMLGLAFRVAPAMFTKKKISRKNQNENWKGLGSARDLLAKCQNAEKIQVVDIYYL